MLSFFGKIADCRADFIEIQGGTNSLTNPNCILDGATAQNTNTAIATNRISNY